MSYNRPPYYFNPQQPQSQPQQTEPPRFLPETSSQMPWHNTVYRGPPQVSVPSMATGLSMATGQMVTGPAMATGPTVPSQQTVQQTVQTSSAPRSVWPTTPTATHQRTETNTPRTPTTPSSQTSTPPVKTENDELIYLAIHKGDMNRKEVRSLLGENVDESNEETQNQNRATSVKSEPATTTLGDDESVEGGPTLEVNTAQLPVLDPTIIPEGEAVVDG